MTYRIFREDSKTTRTLMTTFSSDRRKDAVKYARQKARISHKDHTIEHGTLPPMRFAGKTGYIVT